MYSVTVVGSGIVGLTAACSLQEAGFNVKLISKESYENTLSNKVGAIWFPFEIQPKEKTNAWASLTYKRYQSEVKPGNGVSFIPFLTAYTAESNTEWTKQLPEGTVRKAAKEELPKGIQNAFISLVPLAEPPLYLPYLFRTFLENGGTYAERKISSLQELAGLDNLVINCTDLGAKKLCNDDELQPMRGQILRCKKMNVVSFAETTRKAGLSYIINRTTDCIIGGTDYENDWNENIEQHDTDLILGRLKDFELCPETPEIIEILTGLRPCRSNVRFEFDVIYKNIFHNYGHGGAGFTVAWGCAIELAEILRVKE